MDQDNRQKLEGVGILGEHEVNGQRWWFRMYRNQLRMHFRNSVRRSYVKNLNDGLWHHVAVVNPHGGNSRNLVRFYVDGNEVDSYGQWGQTQILALALITLSNWQSAGIMVRYVGTIDDVRLYSAGIF